jgi:HAD superfamily hydrolase (TIGR01509 family)
MSGVVLQGRRKPDAKVYSTVTEHLAITAEEAVFIDDRVSNVDAAREAGMSALHMTGAKELIEALKDLGINL